MEFPLAFLSNRFPILPKSQNKNVNISRMKGAFKVKQKAFFIILNGVSGARIVLRSESAPSRLVFTCTQLMFLEVTWHLTCWNWRKEPAFGMLSLVFKICVMLINLNTRYTSMHIRMHIHHMHMHQCICLCSYRNDTLKLSHS